MLETICDIMIDAYKRNWITSRDGNVSIRHHGRDHFYVTPSGVRKQTLQPDQFKKIGILDQSVVGKWNWTDLPYTDISTNLKPSGEIELHHGLMKDYEGERCVVHLHPTHTIAALYAGIDISKLVLEFPELGRYTRVAPSVEEVEPISKELADRCMENLNIDENGDCEFDIVAIDRHGVVAIDETPWKAFEHIERLEHICKIVLSAK